MLAYVSKATINRRLEIWLSRYPRVPFRCFRNFHSRKSSNTFRKEFFLTDNLTIVRLFSKGKEKEKKKEKEKEEGKFYQLISWYSRRDGPLSWRRASFRMGSAKSESQSANLHPAFPRRPGIQFPKCFNSFKGCTRRRRGGVARESKLHGWTRERGSPCRSGPRCTPVFPWQP